MQLLEVVLLRLLIWVVIPVGLLVLLIGPARCRQAWRKFVTWVFDGRQEPSAILNRVLARLQQNIDALKDVVAQAERTQAEIIKNSKKSEENIVALEREARAFVAKNDDFGARAALSKLNLERLAVRSFQDQLTQQQQRLVETRRRLHLLELQLRQYEVGRSILLNQLAEARTLEQQYALVNQFDPLGAVAEWHKAEGAVQEAAQNAKVVGQVFNDTADLPLSGQPLRMEPGLLDAQLAELKAQVQGRSAPADNNGSKTSGKTS
jgi:phage shock protein A